MSIWLVKKLNDASMSLRSLSSELVRGCLSTIKGSQGPWRGHLFVFKFPFYTIVYMLTRSLVEIETIFTVSTCRAGFFGCGCVWIRLHLILSLGGCTENLDCSLSDCFGLHFNQCCLKTLILLKFEEIGLLHLWHNFHV
jgi:hypothetical protein